MSAKHTITFIGRFFYLEWNPGRSVSDIFLFQTVINKQPVKQARQEKGKTRFLCYRKAEYPDIVEKLNSRRIACSKQMFPQSWISQKRFPSLPARWPSSSPWWPSSLPWRLSSWCMIPVTHGDGDRLRCEKPRTSWVQPLFRRWRTGIYCYSQRMCFVVNKTILYNNPPSRIRIRRAVLV